VHGPIPRGVAAAYVWGDAITELEHVAPVARIINLETAVTTQDAFAREKAIHYRMHPSNVDSLLAAKIDVCSLANNHVLDYGVDGLRDTLAALHVAEIQTAGAGRDEREAEAPAIVNLEDGRRLLVFASGCADSGIPTTWAAGPDRPGVSRFSEPSDAEADRFVKRVERFAQSGDLAIASIHWGSNWGYEVARSFVRFAHRLIDGGLTLVHGHSSHHPRPMEIYRDRLILYGCGDLLTDYEGIHGYEAFRPQLALMYFPTLTNSGDLADLRLTTVNIRHFQATLAGESDARWLRDRLRKQAIESDDSQP
jgi:poly-gamma-glutamate capsule biosynthesis protein CapA/YwtB (metallophosphatase superfamily)